MQEYTVQEITDNPLPSSTTQEVIDNPVQDYKTEKTIGNPIHEYTTQEIIGNPIEAYQEFRYRLDKHGLNAPFPEFAKTVYKVEEFLSSDPEILKFIDKSEENRLQYSLLRNELFAVQYEFDVCSAKYPHKPSYPKPFPYLPTILAIKKFLEFIDIVLRSTKNNLPPLYHTDRYTYHFHQIYDQSNEFIYFPITDELTLTDFIKTRCIPIGFLGVALEPIFADAYVNSPLDFFNHDANHIRRLRTFNTLTKKEEAAEDQTDCMRNQYEFTISVILPAIQIDPEMNENEKSIRKLLQVIFFELFHEYAFALDLDLITESLLHEPAAPSPFEIMVNKTFDLNKVEELRLPNNNLKSGFNFFRQKESDPPRIKYFFDKGPNILSSAYNKLINGFYDTAENRQEFLPPFELRTKENFIEAAQRLLTIIGKEGLLSRERIEYLLDFDNDPSLERYPNRLDYTAKVV